MPKLLETHVNTHVREQFFFHLIFFSFLRTDASLKCCGYLKKLFSFAGNSMLRVRTVAKRYMRSSMFTGSFILVSRVKIP